MSFDFSRVVTETKRISYTFNAYFFLGLLIFEKATTRSKNKSQSSFGRQKTNKIAFPPTRYGDARPKKTLVYTDENVSFILSDEFGGEECTLGNSDSTHIRRTFADVFHNDDRVRAALPN